MPASTTTVAVSEATTDLDDRLDQIAEEAAQADEDTTAIDELGTTLDQRLADLEDLAEEYGEDATFEIGELTVKERVEFGDLLEATREQQQERRGIEGGSDTRDLLWTAAGVVDAPWLEGDEEMQQRAAALRGLEDYWHVIQYLVEQVTEANAKGNPERRSYAQRRAEKTSANEQS